MAVAQGLSYSSSRREGQGREHMFVSMDALVLCVSAQLAMRSSQTKRPMFLTSSKRSPIRAGQGSLYHTPGGCPGISRRGLLSEKAAAVTLGARRSRAYNESHPTPDSGATCASSPRPSKSRLTALLCIRYMALESPHDRGGIVYLLPMDLVTRGRAVAYQNVCLDR